MAPLVLAAAVGLGAVGLVGSPVAGSTPASAPATGPVALDGFEDYDWWYEAMRLDRAHRRGATGQGVTVALIDNALDLRAAELRGQDIKLGTECYGGPAKSLRPELYAQDDEADHGTSMASLIVGSGRGNAPGGVGVAGVAPQARLLAYDATAGAPGLCRGVEVVDLVDRAVRDGADIISVSLGLDEGLNPAVRRALAAGVVVVGSMGSRAADDVGVNYPAAVPGVVAVQAVDRNADTWERTIPGDDAVIAAPGVEVGALRWNQGTSRLDSLGWGTGTSPATAIVSGALAAVKSKYPDATGNQLIQHLIHNAGGEQNFDWDGTYGFGIVSVTDMLASSPTQWPDENPLLDGPRAAVKDYPAWVSSEVEDPPGKGENAPESAAASDPAQDEGSGSDEAAPEEQDESSGIPGWVWPAAGLVAVAVAGGAMMTRRRGGAAVRAGG